MKICAFIGDMYRDYSAGIIRALQQRAEKNGHSIDIFGNCSVPSMNPLHAMGLKSILSLPLLHEYDGILLCSDTLDQCGMSKELINNLINTEDLPPVVSIRADIAGFYNIIPDNRRIMHDVAEHVIAKCKSGDIGFVTGRDDLADSAERLAGFEDAMHEAGYEVSEDMIFHGNYWTNQGPETADFFTREDGTLPKAIICSNDYMAIALMDTLIIRGYNIPDDTMITGIDNLDAAAIHIPSLTTSEIPEDILANSAIDTLEKITAREQVDFYVSVPGRLILRESTTSDGSRDLFDAYRQLDIIKNTAFDRTRAFVILSAVYEDILSLEKSREVTLENLRDLKLFNRFYLCLYRENDRNLFGYYEKDKDIRVCDISFPGDKILPEQFDNTKAGIRIFLPICYKNVVYGYGVFEIDRESENFIDEKLEFILMLLGQTINRNQLYNRLFAAEDVMAMYIRDPLTELYNRRGYENKLNEFFDDSGTKKCRIALASIDMDGLKYINDTFGHNSGDEAIKAVASCIKGALNKDEFVARMGGDEFEAVLVIDNPGRIGQFIRNLRNRIKSANDTKDLPYTLSASIGTCELTEWGELLECMNVADKAMYLEKKTKKSRT
ncbi:MAG: GGDEF domain-containing protein [Clostridiales bacterium]|nr:GGDEF domain-containing protein [Clostridiales bacterium]